MSQQRIIRQILAGILLLVFSFSITPKKFLHDAIANHKDKITLVSIGDGPQLSHTGFVCKCDNLVAESPFTDAVAYFDFNALPVFSVQKETEHYQFYAAHFFFFELRGPPISSHFI